MTILEDLYYGNINPHEVYIKRGSKFEQLVKLICKNEETLISTLTEQQKEIFEKFKDCESELHSMNERQAFTEGFKLAARLLIEVMQDTDENDN